MKPDHHPAPQASARGAVPTLLMCLLWICAVSFAVYRMAVPPAPPPADSESGAVFRRAAEHLEHIAAELHPVGSEAHERVREYIVAQIEGLGLEALQQTFALADYTARPRWAEGKMATNVLARVEGSGEGPAVMLAAHYDSVPASYGAADDGAAVASMLALLEAYSRAQPPRNDIVFLFSDAEEICLCGANAFANAHPWAADVAMVLNFEARGTGGTSVMFETSNGNGELVKRYAAVVEHPVTTSLFYEVYKYLPNDTDFTWFKKAGMAGLNFAFIDEWPNYHNANDNPASLDDGTFYHQFSNMRQTLSHFAFADLDALEAGDRIFFDFLSLVVIHYPPWLAILFAAVALVGFLYVCGKGMAGALRITRLLGFGLLVFPLSLAGTAALIGVIHGWRMSGVEEAGLRPALFDKQVMVLMLLVAGLLFIVPAGISRRVFSRRELYLTILGYWTLAAVLSALLLPGASYVFVWPLLCVLAGLVFESRGRASRQVSWLIRAVVPLPLLLVWGQIIYMLLLALTLRDIGVISGCLFFGLALLGVGLLQPESDGAQERKNDSGVASAS